MATARKNEAFMAFLGDDPARQSCSFTAEQCREWVARWLCRADEDATWADMKKRGWRVRKITFRITP